MTELSYAHGCRVAAPPSSPIVHGAVVPRRGRGLRLPAAEGRVLLHRPAAHLHSPGGAAQHRARSSRWRRRAHLFVLNDDDPGSSYHHPSIRSSGDGVRAAMAALRPKFASYAPLEAGAAGYANERRVACGMKEEGVTHAIGSRYFMQTFYESHFKLRTCYEEVERYEGTHRFAFVGGADAARRVVLGLMRAALPPPPRRCDVPRRRRRLLVRLVHQRPYRVPAAAPRGAVLHDRERHALLRRRAQSSPLEELQRVAADGARACRSPPSFSFRTRCCARAPTRRSNRTTPSASAGARRRLKNAGLSFFNGTALPDLAKYRRERADLYAQCHQRAAATFPAYAALERGGRLATSATPAGRAGRSHSLRPTPAGRDHGEGSRWATAQERRRCRARSFSTGARGALAVPAAGGRREPCDEPGVALPSVQRLDAPRLVRMPAAGTVPGLARVRLHLAELAAGALGRPTVLGAASARWRVPRHQGAHSHAARRCVRAPARRLWSRGARLDVVWDHSIGPRYLVSWGLAAPAGHRLVTILNAIAGNILGDHRAVATPGQQRLTGKASVALVGPLMLSSALEWDGPNRICRAAGVATRSGRAMDPFIQFDGTHGCYYQRWDERHRGSRQVRARGRTARGVP